MPMVGVLKFTYIKFSKSGSNHYLGLPWIINIVFFTSPFCADLIGETKSIFSIFYHISHNVSIYQSSIPELIFLKSHDLGQRIKLIPSMNECVRF